MLVGNKSKFAIESYVAKAFERRSLLGLGFFVIYVNGKSYGVRSTNATMLACSFDEVQRRLGQKGTHVASFANEPDPGRIADLIREAKYDDSAINKRYFGIAKEEFIQLVESKHLQWAPDGDEAFDDGSHVLQFDIEKEVRLIAYRFRQWRDDYQHDPATLAEVRLSADDFYGILKKWHDAFEMEWEKSEKSVNL